MKRFRNRWLLAPVLVLGLASEARYYLQQESLLFSEERLAVQVLDDSVEPVRRRFNDGVERWRPDPKPEANTDGDQEPHGDRKFRVSFQRNHEEPGRLATGRTDRPHSTRDPDMARQTFARLTDPH